MNRAEIVEISGAVLTTRLLHSMRGNEGLICIKESTVERGRIG